MLFGVSSFDVERFDNLLRESLHQAATEGLSEDELVTRLRQHATAIDQRGLDAHAGVASIPAVSEDHARERDCKPEPTP